MNMPLCQPFTFNRTYKLHPTECLYGCKPKLRKDWKGGFCKNHALNFWVQSFGALILVITCSYFIGSLVFFIHYPSILKLISFGHSMAIIGFFFLIFLTCLILFYIIIVRACDGHFLAILIYALLGLWTFIMLTILSMWLFHNPEAISAYLNSQLHDSLQNAYNDTEMLFYWEATQSYFECCGISGTKDWKPILKEDNPDFQVPDSCCKLKKEKPAGRRSEVHTEDSVQVKEEFPILNQYDDLKSKLVDLANLFSVLLLKFVTDPLITLLFSINDTNSGAKSFQELTEMDEYDWEILLKNQTAKFLKELDKILPKEVIKLKDKPYVGPEIFPEDFERYKDGINKSKILKNCSIPKTCGGTSLEGPLSRLEL